MYSNDWRLSVVRDTRPCFAVNTESRREARPYVIDDLKDSIGGTGWHFGF